MNFFSCCGFFLGGRELFWIWIFLEREGGELNLGSWAVCVYFVCKEYGIQNSV